MSQDPPTAPLVGPATAERTVALIEPDSVPLHGQEPQLVWTAPGSLGAAEALAAYRRGGMAALARVSGPWGVVIWDPGQRCHVIATDPIGVQPVLWARTSGRAIAVSSRIAALADRPDVSGELDHEGILLSEGHACLGEAGLEHTRFTAIRNVPMGWALQVRPDGRVVRHRYYDPRSVAVDESLTLAECSELLAERIDAAVRRAVPGGEGYGAHVSGGLDCTTVACRAHQVLRERGDGLIAGYSWVPPEDEVPRFPGDERDLLDAVTAQEGFPIRRNPRGPHGRWWFERDPNRYPQSTHVRERLVLPVAQGDGVRVMLSGWGGDELASFNGRVVADHLFRTGQWLALWRDGAHNVRRPDQGRIGQLRGGLRRLAGTAFWQLPAPIADLRHPGDYLPARRLQREIDGELRGVSALAADLRRERKRSFRRCTDPHEFQLLLLTGGHLQHRTSGWYQTGELFGVRYRYPLLDLGVVEAALSLPWQAFRSRGWTRVAYRSAASAWVPGEVAWNLHKVEPALFFPPTEPKQVPPAEELAPPEPFQVADPRYGDTVRIAGRSYRRASTRGRVDPGSRVRARTDAAV